MDAFWLNVRIFVVAEALILVVGCCGDGSSSAARPLFPSACCHRLRRVCGRAILWPGLLGFGVPGCGVRVPSSPVFWATVALVLTYRPTSREVTGRDRRVHESHVPRPDRSGSHGRPCGCDLPQAVSPGIPPDERLHQPQGHRPVGAGTVEAARAGADLLGKTFNFTSYVVAAVSSCGDDPLTRLTTTVERQSGAPPAARSDEPRTLPAVPRSSYRRV